MNQARNSESKTHAGKQNRTPGTDLSFKMLTDFSFVQVNKVLRLQ